MAARPDDSDDVALSLTMAVVASSPVPLLLLDGDLNVVAASTSFCDAFTPNQTDLAGKSLYALGTGEWNMRELRSRMDATVSGAATLDSYEVDLEREGARKRRLTIQARRLTYLDLEHLRILVAVTDVTDARADAQAKDDALRQNSVLFQEVRHRVANSLQIIASVLMQNARATQSGETREHLQDAHNRVMSVAALERLISSSQGGEVQVHAYFTSLCDNISASMIGKPDRISLSVSRAKGVVAARTSVSLGLIVTELVINALKYAFPDDRSGTIAVDYDFHGPNWILCVRDDGVGMPTDATMIRKGLGTSIVHALAKQLHASVHIVAAHPGTKISIEHIQIALVADEPASEPSSVAAATPATSNG